MENRRITLWTAPRCVSNAFERSIMEIKKIKILHEPYGHPYYFGPEGRSERYPLEDRDSGVTFDSVAELFQTTYDENGSVFVKDMAYYLDGKMELLLDPVFQSTRHTFLIRHPKKSIVSLYKKSIDTLKTGWDHFNPIEAGFTSLIKLYPEKQLDVYSRMACYAEAESGIVW